MSLEQMKEILRRPWRSAMEEAHGSDELPENSWVPLHIPVQVTVRNSSGVAEVYNARTLLIHEHGAKLECLTPPGERVEQRFMLHQTLWIETGSAQKGEGAEVVWADAQPNINGNFEFAVELADVRTLFDVSLPDSEKFATPKQIGPPPESLPGSAYESASKSEPGTLPMADRVAGLFRDVIESAIQREQDAISARLFNEVRQQVLQAQQEQLESVRKEVAQEVAALEEQLVQHCRSRAEHMLAAVMKTALNALSNQIDEMSARSQQRVQTILKDLGDQLEQRSAQALAEAGARLEEGLEKSAAAMHDTIVRKMLSEITEKQKHVVEQAEKEIAMATEQNLVRLRGGLIRALQELTDHDGTRAV